MLPKALKASIKTNINKKYEVYISLNKEIDIDDKQVAAIFLFFPFSMQLS